jgi:hypothetical protein
MHTREPGLARNEAAKALRAQAREHRTISVLVTINQVVDVESTAAPEVFRRQQAALFAAQDALMNRIYFGRRRLSPADRFETVPLLVMEVNEGELLRLMSDPAVTEIELNQRIHLMPRLEEMRAITKIEAIWPVDRGNQGQGETIAVIDDGLDRELPPIKGHIVDEQCISGGADGCFDPATQKFSESQSRGAFSAWRCAQKPDKLHATGKYCVSHGSQVTSIAAGAGDGTTYYNGFGPKLDVIFVRFSPDEATLATFVKAFELAYTSSKLRLAKVITTSIGWIDLRSDKPCGGVEPSFDKLFKNIRQSGMVITNSAGNDESNTFIDFPGCHPDVLAIGATVEATDKIVKFSDLSYMVDFLSPGNDVRLGPGFASIAGTSFSTPSVAATLAVMRHAFPGKPMDDIVTGLRCGGEYKNRPTTIVSIPRIDASAAYDVLSLPKPKQDFEFNKRNDLDDWTIANGQWKISNGEAVYVPTKKFTGSAIYNDLCLDDFVAEATIKSTTTVPPSSHPTVTSNLLLNYMPKGDRQQADDQLLTGYKLTILKTIGLDAHYNYASIDKLVDYALPVGSAPDRRSITNLCLTRDIAIDDTVANTLRVVKNGRKLQLFVNGIKQCEALTDSDDRFRSIGVMGFADYILSGPDPGRYTSVNYLRVTGK